MGRPTLGKHKKKDVTLTLDVGIYAAAQVYAKKRRTSVSSLVDSLLEKELEGVKKQRPPEAKSDAPAGEQSSMGSTRAFVSHHSGIALIAEEPSSTPSEFLSVHSRR